MSRPGPAYVFVDNSNIFIEGKRVAGELATPPIPSNALYRLDYGKLLTHVLDGRLPASQPKLYGSRPPPDDTLWNVFREKGFDVQVFDRNAKNKEKGVDMQMGIDIVLACQEEPKADVILIAGDADYVPCLNHLRSRGYWSEVWFWSRAAKNLKEAADRYQSLDQDRWVFGYEGTR